MKQNINLVKSVFAAVVACGLMLSAYSCQKSAEVVPGTGDSGELGTLVVSVATKGDNGEAALSDDNKVNMLELFVFRNEGEDSGNLDAYKKLKGDEILSLSDVELRSTTGKKIVYAVLNSHDEDWSGVRTLSDFQAKLALLQKEKSGDFTMVGSAEATLELTAEVPVTVSRLVAKVQLAGLKCDFSGTPYEGALLTDVKVYLTNVYGSKTYALNADASPVGILNAEGLVNGDVEGCAMPSALYKEIGEDVGSAATNVSHSFYCYENMIAAESDSMKFTRLVVEGKLNGNTYYYPININREGFGYSSGNDHFGVRRNTVYTIDVTICRPGSTVPDGVLEYGDMHTTVTIKDWVTLPGVQVQF